MSLVPIIITTTLTLLSGGAAAILAVKRRHGKVAEVLARIALLGAMMLFALNGSPQ